MVKVSCKKTLKHLRELNRNKKQKERQQLTQREKVLKDLKVHQELVLKVLKVLQELVLKVLKVLQIRNHQHANLLLHVNQHLNLLDKSLQ